MAPKVKYPDLHDSSWLRERYLGEQMTIYEIAELLDCSPANVWYAMKKHGVETRPWGPETQDWRPKPCRRCGETFKPSGPGRLYCSTRCARNRRHVCDVCSAEFWSPIGRSPKWSFYTTVICSETCRAAASQDRLNRVRRAYRMPSGYVRVPVSVGTPGSVGRPETPWMLEHRLVMQEAIGRSLLPSETVHHINGDKADNRLENLQLRQGRHGNGVALTCRSCGSHDIESSALE